MESNGMKNVKKVNIKTKAGTDEVVNGVNTRSKKSVSFSNPMTVDLEELWKTEKVKNGQMVSTIKFNIRMTKLKRHDCIVLHFFYIKYLC